MRVKVINQDNKNNIFTVLNVKNKQARILKTDLEGHRKIEYYHINQLLNNKELNHLRTKNEL